MSALERVNILTENERSTITAHGIKLTEVSRLIPMKVAMHRLNKYNWLQIATNVRLFYGMKNCMVVIGVLQYTQRFQYP